MFCTLVLQDAQEAEDDIQSDADEDDEEMAADLVLGPKTGSKEPQLSVDLLCVFLITVATSFCSHASAGSI